MGQCNGCEKKTLGTDAQWKENVETRVRVHLHARERCITALSLMASPRGHCHLQCGEEASLSFKPPSPVCTLNASLQRHRAD